MKEHPILFSGSMVRAILDGRKTQTRRIVKVLGLDFVGGGPKNGPDWNDPSCWGFEDLNTAQHWALAKSAMVDHVFQCPFGQPGDRLWVRESFRFPRSLDPYSPSAVGDKAGDAGYRKPWAPTHYDADGARTGEWRGFDTAPVLTIPGKPRPSIHMPRWASRITLEITGVRVERLQVIKEEDAIAEGIERTDRHWKSYGGPGRFCRSPVTSYQTLWESINGDGSWSTNPWVWVVQFKRTGNEENI